jgi:predicted Zn finger-like uncharacterized protein
MPVLVNCPSCNGPLRVADELLGRKVRCPSCQTIFEAAEPSASRNGGRQDEEVERIDSWKQLDLEMARDRDPAPPPPPPPPAPSPRSSEPPPPMPGLRGAVEIDAGPQDEPRRPAPPPPDDRRSDERGEDRRPEPPREEGDLRPCPVCRRMIHRDSTRCYNCGERLTPSSRVRDDRRDDRDDRRDFRRPAYDGRDDPGGPPRRDSEPHRGTTILVLGILSLVCLLGFCVLAPAVIGVVLGVIGWWMGHVDLAKMKSGRMDVEGEGMTQGGWICSIIGTVLNLLCVLACGGWIVVNMVQDMERNQRQQPGGFQGPAKQGKMMNDGPQPMKGVGGPAMGVVRPRKMRGPQQVQPVGGPPVVAPAEQGKAADAEPEKP